MLNVLNILKSNKYSGAENVVCQIIELYGNDDRVNMSYASPSGPINSVLQERNIDFVKLSKFNVSEIIKTIKSESIDIIIAHDFSATVLASIAKTILKKEIKLISFLHSNPIWLRKFNIKSFSYYITSKKVDTIIGVSNSILNEFYFSKHVKSKFITLENVVNKDLVLSKATESNSIDKFDLIFVGRLEIEKNPIEFIKIVNNIYIKYKLKVNSVMVGDGSLAGECKELIDNLGLDNIKMVGFQENPYKFMNNSKIIIIPSIFEGFGLVAVESMILEKVVLSSGVGGLNNIISGSGGNICHSIDEYSKEIYELLTNENMYKQRSKKSVIKSKNYTNMENYKKILDSILLNKGESINENES